MEIHPDYICRQTDVNLQGDRLNHNTNSGTENKTQQKTVIQMFTANLAAFSYPTKQSLEEIKS
jgi:hypothetical protein